MMRDVERFSLSIASCTFGASPSGFVFGGGSFSRLQRMDALDVRTGRLLEDQASSGTAFKCDHADSCCITGNKAEGTRLPSVNRRSAPRLVGTDRLVFAAGKVRSRVRGEDHHARLRSRRARFTCPDSASPG